MKTHHIALDLDGTILNYTGWTSQEVFDEPYPGAREFVEGLLAQGHSVSIFTARTNFEEVQAFLVSRGFPKLEVTNVKKHEFSLFLDDRALTFNDTRLFETDALRNHYIKYLSDFMPHWK